MGNKNYKCKWCGEDLTTEDLYISADGWAYCCKCSQPLCDVSIQDKDHFIKINLDKIPQAISFKKKFKEQNNGKEN